MSKYFPRHSPRLKHRQLTVMYVKEKHQIITFEVLEQAKVWQFFLKSDKSNKSMIKIIAG